MSILIRGMEMPGSCGECDLCACYVREDGTEENYRCPVTMYVIRDFDERHKHCPLVPIPPHGRLIDADVLGLTDFEIVMCDGSYKEALKMLLYKIEQAPTIIPAEEGER